MPISPGLSGVHEHYPFIVTWIPVAHRYRNTWNGGGGEGQPHVLLKNGFLANCLQFGNTNICCYD